MEPGDPQEQHRSTEAPDTPPVQSRRDTEADRERRVQALRALAQHAGTHATAVDSSLQAPGPRQKRERWTRPGSPLHRMTWFVAAVLVLALVSAAVLVFVPRLLSPEPRPASAVISIDATAHSLGCQQDVAWSPNGSFVAVLGYDANCPQNANPAYETGQMGIYDAKTGKLVRSLQLDSLILRTHRVSLGGTVTGADGSQFNPYISYQGVVWSPSGQQLAFPFVVLQQYYTFQVPNDAPQVQPLSPSTQAGVLLTNMASTTSQVLLAPYSLPPSGYGPSQEWNVVTGKLVAAALTLPPALSYEWGNNGTLLPLQPLSTSTAAPAVAAPAVPAPVGNPIGGKTFSIWQPGLASQGNYLTPLPNTGTGPTALTNYVAGLNLWYSKFAVWSPDGQYLITPAYYGGRMVLPGQPTPSSHDLQVTGQETAPLFPPHDSALQTVYAATMYVSAAWRSDGKELATVSYHVTNGGKTLTASLTVWDCTTGKELRSLSVAAGGVTSIIIDGVPSEMLRWSPDGSQLLYFDPSLNGQVTIWHVR